MEPLLKKIEKRLAAIGAAVIERIVVAVDGE
jgi:hypothetical protein